VNSCLILAVTCHDVAVTTVEGLSSRASSQLTATAHERPPLHPVQEAFATHDALQCGYCTPGQICSAVGMLEEVAAEPGVTLDEHEIRERMSGNLCRCGAYVNIVAAIQDVAGHQSKAAAQEVGVAR
jgi:xanthine dehydrogenase YagT iron-sulfur-binding subunit